jgi:two-component system sensor histidine kinase DegS
MTETAAETELSPLEEYILHAHNELDQVSAGLREISLLIEQSQGEVDRLAQRNASITSRLHQIKAQFEVVPREDIQEAYEQAQDTQQRLFTMRGQLEKLQSDQTNLVRYENFLNRTIAILEEGVEPPEASKPVPVGTLDSTIQRVIEAQENERRKISKLIHDGPAQALSNFILQTEIAMRLFDVEPEKAREELNNLKEAASSTFSQVRDFIFDLRPMMLDDLGLIPTARRYTEAYREKTGLDISLVITGTERRLESHREVVCFRAIQEVLGNIRDHAQATQVKLSIYLDDDEVRVTCEDNGRGIAGDFEQDESDYATGLQDVKELLSQLGGDFKVESTPDDGTKVALSMRAV